MNPLIGAHCLSKSYGSKTLFENISFTITEGDKIGLIGPNGSGKSTLLKVLMGMESPDQGRISKRQNLRIGYSSQSPTFPAISVEELLRSAAQDKNNRTRAQILLSKAEFPSFDVLASDLSGGWKKRLDILQAYMIEPDLVLLDEPTNHLDLEGILWLEKFLLKEKVPYLIISHDRYFLEKISSKVIELNRIYEEGLLIVQGNMSTFNEQKIAYLKAEEHKQQSLKNLVKMETNWLRTSPKARTTKSEARIQRAHELISNLSELKERNQVSKVAIDFTDSERSTRKLIAAKNIAKSLGGRPLFQNLDIILSPKNRLGIVGKNGTGKTTLLKVLAGLIPQDVGTIKYASDLLLVYFDQHKEQLPPDLSIKEVLADSKDHVTYRGQEIHVNGYAKRFLFSPDRLNLPIHCLSGGERARLLIAKLMLKSADVLFLDEPTNDLDIPTLEVIEESLLDFNGAVVMISHDRALMDRVCTQILAIGTPEEQGYYADYSQWEKALSAIPSKKIVQEKSKEPLKPKEQKKLSYLEQRELDGMEASIEKLEKEIALLCESALPCEPKEAMQHYQNIADLEKKLEELFSRWQFLLSKI